MAPLPGPYSGTSTLALVARTSAFTFGLVYGSMKLKYLKGVICLFNATYSSPHLSSHVQKMKVTEMSMVHWMCGHAMNDIRNEKIWDKFGETLVKDKMREARLKPSLTRKLKLSHITDREQYAAFAV
ncbi:hypothetical protein H5410_010100 [Solanum commersonii]|uniref:Uncharacterized protein n=1 Tax=Solanum commersonii TaxID=4109 RepID=A0A9J6ALC3_SOLCO|nr:hypothetical protein H5410_010100 [Solanum commersonii]